jgi:hypothetical protein
MERQISTGSFSFARGHVDQLAQRPARDVLHRDEVAALVLAQLEYLHDVAVVHPRGEARFSQEELDEFLVLGEVGQDLLDDEDLLEPGRALLLGEKDLAHAAGRHLLQQEILAVVATDVGLRLRGRHGFCGAPRRCRRAAERTVHRFTRSSDPASRRQLLCRTGRQPSRLIWAIASFVRLPPLFAPHQALKSSSAA